MSDLANVWRGSKEKKPSRNDEVLAWFTSTIIKDTSIDNIQKAKLFEDYRDILKKKNEGKATKKELDRYTFNKVFLDIKDGDLTDRKIKLRRERVNAGDYFDIVVIGGAAYDRGAHFSATT